MNKQDLDPLPEKSVFKFGDAVELLDGNGTWRPGKIVKEMVAGESARFKIHFDNTRTSCDEWISFEDVISKMRHQADIESLGDFVNSDIIKNMKNFMSVPKRAPSNKRRGSKARLSPPSAHNNHNSHNSKNNLSVASTTELAYSLTDSNISISTNGNNDVPSSSSTGKENCDQNEDLANTTDEIIEDPLVPITVSTSNNNPNKRRSRASSLSKNDEAIIENETLDEEVEEGKTYNTRRKPVKKYTLETIIIDDSFKDKITSPSTSNSQKKTPKTTNISTTENDNQISEVKKKSVKKSRTSVLRRASLKKRKRPTLKKGASLLESSYDENTNEHSSNDIIKGEIDTKDSDNQIDLKKSASTCFSVANKDFVRLLKKIECNCGGKFDSPASEVFIVVCACCRTNYHNVCVGIEIVNSQAKFVCKNCISKKKCRKLGTFSTNWRTNWMYAKRFKDERLNNRLGLNERTNLFLFIEMAEKLKNIREKLKCAKFEEGSEQQLAKLEQLKKIQSLIQQYERKQTFF